MMTCAQVRQVWDEHHDGELTTGQEQALREHLARCPRCAALAQSEQRWLDELRHEPMAASASLAMTPPQVTPPPAMSPDPPADAAFTERVLQAWAQERAQASTHSDPAGATPADSAAPIAGRIGPRRGMWSRWAALAALLVLVVGLWSWSRHPSSTPGVRSTPAPAVAQAPPVGQVMQDMQQRWIEQPLALVSGMHDVDLSLDWAKPWTSWPVVLPDPARWVEPENTHENAAPAALPS